MPYTPPSQRSPASSKTNSPILSRNHSYVETAPAVQRPALPRSVSSASYLNKHRRSPSFPTVDLAAVNGLANAAGAGPLDAPSRGASSQNGSIRPSPRPVNDSLIPPGAITTPPDSSDDEERGRRNEGTLRELHDALHHHIDIKRAPSPTRDATTATSSDKPQPPPITRSLSAEARKIAHSRSSSEMNLLQHVLHPMNADATTSSSDGSDAEDDELRIKPPLLRKKSGELVKPALRPPSSRRRPSSMPGTPTYSKAVHFNEDIEQVRHFLQVDRPIAVSAGTSPVETYDSETEYPFGEAIRAPKAPEWDIKLTNFPSTETYERQIAPVRVERIFLASDNKTLVGSIACANIAFQKLVVARFTLDYWKTTSEVVAEFNHDIRKKQKDDGYDRFNFNIKLADQANLESKTLLLCARYQVNGQEFWDNNASMNYQVDFSKKAKQKESKRSSAGGLGAIPRSRHSPLAPRPRSMPPAVDDDFGHDMGSKFQFGSSAGGVVLSDSPTASIRLKPRSKRGSIFPDQAPQRATAGQPFAARYDFSASLSAALSSAQDAMGNRSGLKINTTTNGNKGYFDRPAPVKAHTMGPVPGTRPDSLSLEKPDLQSAEYNELIQKFCFFGTPSGKTSPPGTTPAMDTAQSDGTMDSVLDAHPASNGSSATSSPASPAMPLLVDGASDLHSAQIPSPFLSRAASPGPVTGSGPEDLFASQLQFGFNNMPGGMFPERSHTPTACV